MADYSSEFDFGSDTSSEISLSKNEQQKISHIDPELLVKPSPYHRESETKGRLPTRYEKATIVETERARAEGHAQRTSFQSMDAYNRHKYLVNNYMRYYGGSWDDFKRDSSGDKRDIDIIREKHRFVWDSSDDTKDWGSRLAKRYWEKLFKEYCIVDLSHYKIDRVGMRWRLEREVISGKGQFTCGNKACDNKEKLKSWEVNFGYVEQGEKKNALVKVRLCADCSDKLNYKHQRREVVARKRSRHSPSSSAEEASSSKVTRLETSPEAPSPAITDETVWQTSAAASMEKTQEDEMDDYMQDLFM